jgi:hypothetical protein
MITGAVLHPITDKNANYSFCDFMNYKVLYKYVIITLDNL